MKKFPATALSGMLGILFAMSAHADVPSLLPVQGVLADASDVPVDDLVDMTFTIYPSELGGIPVWTEVYDGTNQVDVEDGFFTVYLGEVQALDLGILADEPELWLGITVGTDSEMDRIRLATVPFAVEAHRCEQIGEITEADISGAPFYGITSSQVSGWDAASAWGDHSAAGYLTSEVDPIFSASAAATITTSQMVDWDAAYGWGDHNGLYAPADHKHDDLYYTETELQTSGAAQVHYGNLTNVPDHGSLFIQNSTGAQPANFHITGTGEVGGLTSNGDVYLAGSRLRISSCPAGMRQVESNLCIDENPRTARTYWVEAASTCRKSGFHMCTFAELDQVLCHENSPSVLYNPNGFWIGDYIGDDTVTCGNVDITTTGCKNNFAGDCNKIHSAQRQYWCCLSYGTI